MTDHIDLQRRLVGYWQLPETDSYSITIGLFQDKNMSMTIAALSGKERLRQTLSGDQARGTWFVTTRRRERGTAGRALGSSSSSLSKIFRPPILQDGSALPEKGPFLGLNISDAPRAIANMKIAGVPLDIANWAISIDELAGGKYAKIVNAERSESEVEMDWGKGIEVWRRVDTR